jgi:hypothetical protein
MAPLHFLTAQGDNCGNANWSQSLLPQQTQTQRAEWLARIGDG